MSRTAKLYLPATMLAGSAFGTGLRLLVGWQTALMIVPALYSIYRSYRRYLGQLEAEKDHVKEMAGLHLRTIEALALEIGHQDQHSRDHLRRVGIYAVALGKELGLSKPELQALRAASMLHDIGTLAVPEHIVSKPGKLTPVEFEKMKIHPLIGAKILERVGFPYPVAPIVHAHHEKWDGTGYPSGLKGEAIPIGARILSAVDCFDAMTTHRRYRRALSPESALAFIIAESGQSFNPRVFETLVRIHPELDALVSRARPRELPLPGDVKIPAL